MKTKPQWIKIGPGVFELAFKPDTGNAGKLDYQPKMRLVVNSDYDLQYQLQTLFHEIQHGIFDTTGHEELNKDEGLVERLSHAWLDVLLESPDLLEYLIAMRNKYQ